MRKVFHRVSGPVSVSRSRHYAITPSTPRRESTAWSVRRNSHAGRGRAGHPRMRCSVGIGRPG